jgi:hypothetical protein
MWAIVRLPVAYTNFRAGRGKIRAFGLDVVA